uniref:Olfactory receptor C family, q1 n=1 Tax=Cyprinus carpio TaxID=7962 RepID=A0A8C2FD17_CYPCA
MAKKEKTSERQYKETHFGWTWVGLVYSNDDYGIYAAQSFQKEVQLFGGCVSFSEILPLDNNHVDIQRIVQGIQASTARVVVVFSTEAYLLPLMDEVVLQNVTGRQWIASEAWATSPVFHTQRLLPFLGGTLGIAIRRGEIQGLHLRNNMVRIFWENIFGCSFDTGGREGEKLCTGQEDLSSTETAYSDVRLLWTEAQLVSYTVHFKFYSSDGSIVARTVGVVDEGAARGKVLTLEEDAIYWNIETSKVSIFQTFKRLKQNPPMISYSMCGLPVCCFDCLPCADGVISNISDLIKCTVCPDEFWSNPKKDECVPKEVEFLYYEETLGISLSTASLLGTCICSAVVVIFAHHRHTPVVRANNSELSFLLLLSLKLCFLCVLLFIGWPQLWTCQLRHAVFGISFVLCIASILVKTIVVIAVFKLSRPEGKSAMKWFGAAQQRCTVLVLTALQVICEVWLSNASPAQWLGFPSFLARNLPDNFNEAKFITFSMLIFCAVWIAFFLSSPGKYAVAVELFAILALSFGLLVAIFAPNCYIILHPERNTKKAIMGRTA